VLARPKSHVMHYRIKPESASFDAHAVEAEASGGMHQAADSAFRR